LVFVNPSLLITSSMEANYFIYSSIFHSDFSECIISRLSRIKKGLMNASMKYHHNIFLASYIPLLVPINRKILNNLPQGFTALSLDESFFFFDSLIRKVWISKNRRPMVTVTGSHRHSCLFGALSLGGKQLFRQTV
jgi:hypothetical protein